MTDEQERARQERLLRYKRDQIQMRIAMLQQQINQPPPRSLPDIHAAADPPKDKWWGKPNKPRRLHSWYRRLFHL